MSNLSSSLSVALLRGLGSLPLSWRKAFARGIGGLISVFPFRDRNVAMLQIGHFLGTAHPSAVCREVFKNFAMTFFETLNLFPILQAQKDKVIFEKWADFKAQLQSGKGVIVLTGHVGNWELLAAAMHARGVDFHALGRPARGEINQALLQDLRARYGVRTLWRSDSAGVREIVRQLKRGGCIAGLIDQDTEVSSIFVPFFGVPAKTPSALVEIGKRLGCCMCTLFLVREDRSRYRVLWSELDGTKTAAEILSDFNMELESIIRRYPGQWAWFHKRWRTRPDNRKLGSRNYIEALTREPHAL